MDVVGEVKSKSRRLTDKENYPTWLEMYHKEFSNVDLDRSSQKEENPNEIHLGFMQ